MNYGTNSKLYCVISMYIAINEGIYIRYVTLRCAYMSIKCCGGSLFALVDTYLNYTVTKYKTKRKLPGFFKMVEIELFIR